MFNDMDQRWCPMLLLPIVRLLLKKQIPHSIKSTQRSLLIFFFFSNLVRIRYSWNNSALANFKLIRQVLLDCGHLFTIIKLFRVTSEPVTSHSLLHRFISAQSPFDALSNDMQHKSDSESEN